MNSSSDTHALVEAQNLGRLAGEPKKVKAARRTGGGSGAETSPQSASSAIFCRLFASKYRDLCCLHLGFLSNERLGLTCTGHGRL